MDTNMKNLTRYTLEKTSFLGWRVCISRKGVMFTKYFPDKAYNGEDGSLAAAVAVRDEILARIAAAPENAKKIMQEMKNRFSARKRKKRK